MTRETSRKRIFSLQSLNLGGVHSSTLLISYDADCRRDSRVQNRSENDTEDGAENRPGNGAKKAMPPKPGSQKLTTLTNTKLSGKFQAWRGLGKSGR